MYIKNLVSLSQDAIMINIHEEDKLLDLEYNLSNISQDILNDKLNKVCQMVNYEVASLYDHSEYINFIKEAVSKDCDKSCVDLSQMIIASINASKKSFVYQKPLPWFKISFAAAVLIFLISKFVYIPKYTFMCYFISISVLISIYSIGIFFSKN